MHFRPFLPTRKNSRDHRPRSSMQRLKPRRPGKHDRGPLIEIEGLRSSSMATTAAPAMVRSFDLSVANGATLGPRVESGCSKRTSLAYMGLRPKHSAEVSGSIRFDGLIARCPRRHARDLARQPAAMIFQEPSLAQPSFTIGDQIIESFCAIAAARGGGRASARSTLRVSPFPSPDSGIAEYPTSFPAASQLVMTRWLWTAPAASDRGPPTTALDVTLQLRSSPDAELRLRRRGDHPDHPRSRRRRRGLRRSRRDVCRRDRRARAGR